MLVMLVRGEIEEGRMGGGMVGKSKDAYRHDGTRLSSVTTEDVGKGGRDPVMWWQCVGYDADNDNYWLGDTEH
jgi:hypothetical protein